MALSLRATLSLRHIQLISSRAIFMRAPYHRMVCPIAKYIQNDRQYTGIQFKPHQTSARYMNTSPATDEDIDEGLVDQNEQSSNYSTKQLTRAFSRFESICTRKDRVSELEFVRIFNALTLAVERLGPPNDRNSDHYSKISAIAGTLLRSCGKSMVSTTEKARELLAGNLWTYIKEKQIPIDISHYNSLIRTLNENNTNFEPKTLLNEINKANLKPDRITYQRLIHQYCLQGNIQEATALLEVMKDSNMELNETVFASLIIGYNKQPTPPSTSEIFDLMRVNGIEPGNKTYSAAIISKAQSSKNNPDAVNQVRDLLKMASDEDVSFTNVQLAELLVALLQLKEKHEVVKDLLFQAEKSLRGPISDRYLILSSLVRVGHHEDAADLYWKQHFSERALETKRVGGYFIESLVHHHDVPVEFIIEQCDRLISEGHHSDPYSDLYFKGASCGNLPAVRASLKKMTEEGRARGPHYWPLIAQAKDEPDMLRTLKSDLNRDFFTSDELVETFSNWVLPKLNGDIKKLLDVNEKELHFDKNIIATAYLDYSIQVNKLEDAMQFLKDTQPGGIIQESDDPEDMADSENDPNRRSSSLNREFPIRRILGRVAETTNNPELVTKAYELCHIPPKSVSVQCLQPLIDVHLKNDDFNGALEKFLRISQEHKKTPCARELMTVCLNNKDPESLQKIMQAVSDIRGQTAALLDLAICCLKVKKLNQAQKILANPSLRIWPEKIYETAKRMATENSLDMLESFVKLTRDIPDVNKDILYDILIKYYARTNQAERALHLWNTMQEDDFEPSRKIMSMIADILEDSGMEVPFHRPPKLDSVLDRVRKSRTRSVRKTVSESKD